MQNNVTEVAPGNHTMAPLLLIELMRDLAVLEEELRSAEDNLGLPASSYQEALTQRLSRLGVSDQYVQRFVAWRLSLSSLIAEEPNDELQLAKIVVAEDAGRAVFAEVIASVTSAGKHHEHSAILVTAHKPW